jgi:hypothetical protein
MRLALFAGAFLISLWCLIVGAAAHQAPSGWAYPPACCSLTDCNEIDASRVSQTPEGYLVRLVPGDHNMAKNGGEWLVPYDKARPSPDGEAHICINGVGKMLCFFIGLGSS